MALTRRHITVICVTDLSLRSRAGTARSFDAVRLPCDPGQDLSVAGWVVVSTPPAAAGTGLPPEPQATRAATR